MVASALFGCSAGSGGTSGDPVGSLPADTTAPPARKVAVSAGDLFFDPAELHLRAGERVELVVANDGAVDHNLTIQRLDVHQQLDVGETERITIEPDAGTYVYLCGYHTKMRGTLVVQ